MLKVYKRTLLGGGLTAFLATLPSLGATQETSDPKEPWIEEIIVTAQKREETLQDVPIAVTVLSGNDLKESNVNSLSDLKNLSPNLIVQTNDSPSQSAFTIRGIGTAAPTVGFEQSVGVYVDGVLRGRPGSAMQDLVDLERIEVLRGPQATIFGRNNSAGAINVTTASPKYEFGGNVQGTFGDSDLLQFQGSLTGPLIDEKVAFRLSASHREADGFYDNLVGPDSNRTDRQSLRGQLQFDMGDNTTLRVIGDLSEADDICCTQVPIFIADADLSGPPTPGILFGRTPTNQSSATPATINNVTGTLFDPFGREFATTTPNREETTDWGVSAELIHDFGSVSATILPAFRSFDSNALSDADTGDGFVSVQNIRDNKIEEFSFEARLNNTNPGFIDWLAGIYYFDQDISSQQSVLFGPTSLYDGDADLSLRSFAAFGQVDIHVTDRLTLTGGLRYLTEENDITNIASGETTLPNPMVPIPGTSSGSNSVDDDAWMGSASLAYEFNSTANVYARYGHGYKSGGHNVLFVLTPITDSAFAPETVDSYEVGSKLKLLNGNLLLNATLFYQKLDNMQVQTTDGFSVLTINAAEVESKGFELNYIFAPVENLLLSGGLVYLDSTYDDFIDAPLPLFVDGLPLTPNCGIPAPFGPPVCKSQDLTGQRTTNSPKWTITGSVEYTQLLSASWAVKGRMDFRYQSAHYTNLANDDLFKNGDTFTLDLSLSVLNEDQGYGVRLWGKNLTDEEIIGSGTPIIRSKSAAVRLNDPATWGVTAFVSF